MFGQIIGHIYYNDEMQFIHLNAYVDTKPTNDNYYWFIINIPKWPGYKYYTSLKDLKEDFPQAYIDNSFQYLK